MKRLISFLLFAALTLGVCLSGIACGGKQKEEEATVTPSDYDIVTEGVSDYKIVYPAGNTSSMIETAVSELQYFFEEATGVALPAVPDSGLSHSADARVLSVGETSLLKSAGVTAEHAALTPTGYKIQTVDRSVYMVGGGIYGSLNAVYGFLAGQFGYECYAPDEISLDRGVRNAKLMNFSVTDVPDITWRPTSSGELMQDTQYARRLRMNMQSDFIMEFGGVFYHNYFEVVNPDELSETHPEWFSNHGLQLCFTRDPEGLADYVFEKMKAEILANPDAYALGFTQEDDGGWCSCDECKKSKEKYGADSASQILFMNNCARKLKAWLEETGSDREVYLYMFAYQAVTDAPAHYNADTGKYEPNAPELVMEDNLLVQYAPIYAAGYHSYDREINAGFDEIMKKWSALTEHFMFWSYNYYYKVLNWPYFDFSDLREQYKYMVNNKVMYLFEEDRTGCAHWCDWSRYKAFIRAKLAWDTDADLNALTDAFFDNYYKDAAPYMRRLFDEYATHYTLLIEENNLRGQGNTCDVDKEEYWPKAMLDQWIGLIEKAYDEIEYLKAGDPALYQTLFDRICLDSISFRFMSEALYSSSIYVGDGNTLEEDRAKFGMNERKT